jgi:pyridoxamine 5'-phosphate oxidase
MCLLRAYPACAALFRLETMPNNSPLKIAVLISGSGSTLMNLVEQIANGKLNCVISLVIASRNNLKGLERAIAANLPTIVIDPREAKDTFSDKVFSAIDQAEVDLVCLAGWLCLLNVPPRYEGKILNIHPSLLPSFGGKGMYGLKVHQAVLERGCNFSGCTVHFVDNAYDNGPILLQRICPVIEGDTAATLAARVFELEKLAFPEAIKIYQSKLQGSAKVPVSISDIRKDYQLGELHESDVSPDPVQQFAAWFADAERAKVAEPTAMTLATADVTGRPSARIVLLKGFDSAGFVFYSNYQSRKGRELKQNPQASLVFFWTELERQVRINGYVQQVTREESEKYFHSRPIGSQIGAIASQQSSVLSSRSELEKAELELRAKFTNQPIPMPDYWGGYRVIPTEIEFWQGRSSRLHDRLRYTLVGKTWKIERLSP